MPSRPSWTSQAGVLFLSTALFFAGAGRAHADHLHPSSWRERWYFQATVGGGHQPSTDIGLLSTDLEIGLRPFLGSLAATVSLDVQTAGERLTIGGLGFGLTVDLPNLFATLGGRMTPLPVTCIVGGRVLLAYGASRRRIPLADGTVEEYGFMLLQPEFAFHADVRIEIPDQRQWVIVPRGVIHVAPGLGGTEEEISRWEVALGFAYLWGFEDAPME